MGFVCDQWFSDQLVDGSMLGCWLQVAGDLVIYWLPGYLLLVTGILVTGLSGYVLVTGSLKSKRTVAMGLLYWPRDLWFHRQAVNVQSSFCIVLGEALSHNSFLKS